MYLPDFTYHKPATLEEACKLLETEQNAAAIAGGTDILVEIKNGLRQNDNIISLSGIGELKKIEKTGNQLLIGAAVTHNEVKNSELVSENVPALAEAAALIGSDQVRNTGTIGGNLCTGASCCDMAPVLIASNASVEIVSINGKRIVAMKDFFIFHKETSVKKGEIMTKIIVPCIDVGTGICFKKFGLRDASAISVASASVMIKADANVCVDAAVVVGAVAPTPKIISGANKILIGSKLTDFINNKNDLILKEIGEEAVKESLPIDDIRGSAQFRRNLVSVLSKRAALTAALRAKDSL